MGLSQRIMVTGGRAPATLDLVRVLSAGGHKVWLAETMGGTITSFSNRLQGSIRLTSPLLDFEAFAGDLERALIIHKIDLLLPTCEEVFWIGRAHQRLSGTCLIFTPPLTKLRQVHSKYEISKLAESAGLISPVTHLISGKDELKSYFDSDQKWVLKPEFSRFGSRVLIKPSFSQAVKEFEYLNRNWVLQQFIRGDEYAVWSVFQKGNMVAFCSYPIVHKAGIGSAIWFTPRDVPGLQEAVRQMGGYSDWTGQLAFDFIVPEGGTPVLIECNPRLTSGIHLFRDQPGLSAAITCESEGLVLPTPGKTMQLTFPMWSHGLPRALARKSLIPWWHDLKSARDILWYPGDFKPFFMQGYCLTRMKLRAVARGVSLLDATTADIEWNGS
ncbi:MAG: ATP-grasp domain-containing protein [Spirochaetales bacterium]|nr:ATP-grasp domain-containing protein [Spirochaetales bacterium]